MSDFGMSKEGASSVRPPLLTGVNYASWKGKMEAYLCQIHDRAWMAIEDGYAPPMMTPTGGGDQVIKPKADWTNAEFEISKWNRKAWHALLCAVDENQYKLIQNTKIAKEAWDILEVAHEGTDVVKDSKLQVLQTQFELLKMEEDECFNDFEVKLMDIVNQSYQLGDPYSDRRVKQKIMRSLPARFESKVTALEENSDYRDMKPSEVIGRLLAYESRIGPSTSPPKKQKGIALKASKVEKEEKDDSDEDTALLLRRFKKFVKFEKNGYGSKGQELKKKAPFKRFEPRQENSERKGIQCYECGGIGHISPDCGNLKNKTGKVMAATWSDDSGEGDKSSSDDDITINYTAFGATFVEDIVDGKKVVTSDPKEERDEEVALDVVGVATHWDMSITSSRNKFDDLDEEDDSIGELENIEDDSSVENLSPNSTKGSVEKMDVHDFIVKCESSMMKDKRKIKILVEENLELSSHNDHLSKQVEMMGLKDNIEGFESSRLENEKEIQSLKEENLRLSTLVDHLSSEVVRSMEDEDKLKEELALSKRNEEGLKRELRNARDLISKLTSSTEKLNHLLSVGKGPSDKRGLGFEEDKENLTPNKTIFVKSLGKKEASPVLTPRKKIDLGQCSHSAQVKVASRRQPQAQRVPHANFPQPKFHKGKTPIMQAQVNEQPCLGQQQRRRDPIQQPRQPQRQWNAPKHAHGNGMIPNFIPTCHFCGIDGHIRPSCFYYIQMCRVKSMIEKRKARARMHVNIKEETHLHDPLTSKALEPLSTRKKSISPKWIRKNNEPACYETNKSHIGSTESNGLGRSIGPHDLH